MKLTELQLAPYLLEVREVAQLMLQCFGEIRELASQWTKARDSEDEQLAQWQAGVGLDDATWGTTISNRARYQAEFFSRVEAFLAGWARLSLLIFPIEGKGTGTAFRAARGSAIREALGVSTDSVLADRELRDSWMHFDERLDTAIQNGTFRERHRFLRSVEATPYVGNTIALLEVDTLTVRYTQRDGTPASLDLSDLDAAIVDLLEALRNTIAG